VAILLQGVRSLLRKWRIAVIFTAAALMALVSVIEALILIFHTHGCPSGWAPFSFDAPVGEVSLIAAVPLLLVTLNSALVSLEVGHRRIRGVLERAAFSSLTSAISLMTVTTVIALMLLYWGVIPNLGSSASGCLTY